MTIFYSIISVLFFAFTYMISRENGNSIVNSLLLGLLLLVAWPVILALATVYLVVGRFLRKRVNDSDSSANGSDSTFQSPMSEEDFKNLKEALTEKDRKSMEEIVEEQVNQNWEEIKS